MSVVECPGPVRLFAVEPDSTSRRVYRVIAAGIGCGCRARTSGPAPSRTRQTVSSPSPKSPKSLHHSTPLAASSH
jgi:hypothetical protein